MKTIIAGSRGIKDLKIVEAAVKESGFAVTEVISGCAQGVDTLGELWAKNNKIPVKKYPADWGNYGRFAGYKRNAEMAEYADALIACWDGTSKGTKHMIDTAQKKGLKIYVKEVLK